MHRPTRSIALAAVLATMLAGCGLPKPTYTNNTLIKLDGRNDCSVWGTWERYTWTGGCDLSLANGAGVLEGYSGTILMLRYTGDMKDGLRDGNGDLWLNKVKVNGGPLTRNGSFSRGRFMDGVETDDYGSASYAAGTRGAFTPARSASGSSGGSGMNSMTTSMLGAVATGLASAGGKNAPALGAMGTALQGNNNAGGASTRTSSQASGAELTEPAVTQCVSTSRTKYSVIFRNTCQHPIRVTYCFVSLSGNNDLADARDAACNLATGRNHKSTPVIGPSATNSQGAPANNAPINYVACRDDTNDLRAESFFRWDGQKLQGTCGGLKGRINGGNANALGKSMGAVR